jgi:4-amino-4-deoxy-L-arabinose transferase-like glycosyltransferase
MANDQTTRYGTRNTQHATRNTQHATRNTLQLSRERLYRVLLLLFIALAFARGVYGLGFNSLWWDESLSLQRANYDLPDILSNKIILTDAVRQVITLDNHPPLYFLLLHLVVKLAGQSEFALRFPSLAFSVLTVSLLYTVGKHLFDERTGLLAALLGAISPLYLWYSHEARMYTMLTFGGLLSFYSLLRILTSSVKRETSNVEYRIPNLQLPIIYVLSSAAMVTTHYLGFLVLLAELVIFLSFLRRNTWQRVAIPVLVVLLIAVPILYYGLSILPEGEMAGFRFIPLLELLRDVANSFSLGISVQAEKVLPVYWVFRGVFLIGALAAGWRAFRPLNMALQLGSGQAKDSPWSPKALSALFYLLVPVFSIYLLSYVRPAYMNIRHLIMVSPAFYLILALGLATISKRWRWIFASCLVLIVAGSAYSTQQYFYNEKYAKDDHRAWGEYLKAHAQPGDVIVVDPPHIAQIYHYYADAGLPWIGLPRLVSPEEVTISALEELMAQYDRIWLALSHTPPWGDPEFLPKKWLGEHAFLVDDRGFHSYASLVQVFCFLTSSPVLETMPVFQHPLEANFEDKLIFLGYDLKGKPVTSGQFVHLNLYWKVPSTLGELREDYGVSLRLLDGENRLWGQADRRPLNGHYPTSQWQPGQIIKDDYELLVDVGTPPGWYRLEMVVHNGNRPLTVVGEGSIPQGTSINMGSLQVGKPTSPPALATLPVEHRLVKDFGGLQLLGYDLTQGNYRPGDWVWVRPYWRAKRKLVEDYSFYLRLLDEHKWLWAQKVIRPAGDSYPTSFWDEGEVVKGQHTLHIPPDAPAGEYYVEIVLREPEIASSRELLTSLFGAVAHGGHALDIGKIQVIELEREFAVPPIQHPYQVNLGGRVELLGYDLGRTEFSPGEVVPLTLYWRALEQMHTSYTVFTHLVGEDNRIWGQQDNPPQEGQHPTNLWVKGEVVTDSYNIPIKSDAPPGEYVIEVGLYNAATGVRLPVLDEQGERIDDRVLLQKIRVITH